MICPKCQSQMRTVDKDGVHIEQCSGCRGIFLDQGELERITRAENSYYEQPPPYRPYTGNHGPGRGHHDNRKRRKRSFLEELFD
jgi:Zn-finger nucleic acid-binding protein